MFGCHSNLETKNTTCCDSTHCPSCGAHCNVAFEALLIATGNVEARRIVKDNGPYPHYWDFPEEIPEKLRKRSQSVSWNPPPRVRLRSPKPYNSRVPEHFQNSLLPVRLGAPLFHKWFRRGPFRAGPGIPSTTGSISEIRLRICGDSEF